MTTADPTVDTRLEAAPADVRTASTSSIVRVLTSSDHKVIGQLYIASSMLGLAIVGVLGVLLGIERIDGNGTLLDQAALSQLFSGYRVGLVFAALIPMFLGITVFIVPLQLGARSLAFPRAAAVGFWGWLFGAALLIVALANNGGPFGGNRDMVGLYLAAYGLMAIGLTATAATVAVSVLTTRAPGMRMGRVPPFAWSALVWAIGIVLVLPVLVGVLVYLYIDYQYTGTLFGKASGIYGWTSFVITGPLMALFAVPAVGVVAELIPVTFRARLARRGGVRAGLALLGLGLLAGVAQQDVAPATWWDTTLSRNNYGTMLAEVATFVMFVGLPVIGLLMVFAVGALNGKPKGRESERPSIIAPFVFSVLGAGVVLLGLVGNLLVPFQDLSLRTTVFEEGATVAVVYGSVLAGLGAVAYWFPKAAGVRLPEGPLFGLALIGALGAVLASVPYGIAGFTDQPGYSAVWSNDGPGGLWNFLVAAGHALFLLAVLAFAGLAMKAWSASRRAGAADDPWGAQTLEWATGSPAPFDNFDTTPTVMSPEPILDLTAASTGAEV